MAGQGNRHSVPCWRIPDRERPRVPSFCRARKATCANTPLPSMRLWAGMMVMQSRRDASPKQTAA